MAEIQVGDKKISRFKHYEQAAKSLKRKPKELEMPPLRRGLFYLWDIFTELFNATQGQITYTEIAAYCRFNGDLSPFEVEAVQSLQREYLRSKNG